MWTYNSADALERSLPSIKGAIDEESVCHKIAVDGGSRDETQAILNRFGWTVVNAPKKGIPLQANYALGMVDTEFFAAFEHDIILNPKWFERTSRIVGSDQKIGASQGLRLYAGSKSMQAFEEWMYRTNRIPIWSFSIDNTLFRTEAVRRAGGFPIEDPASADTILRRNLFRFGYRWITDYALLSGHYRKNFSEQLKHQVKLFELARYSWSSSPEGNSVPRHIISLLGGNPIHVLNMTLQSRMLRVPLAWYILRIQRGIYLSLPHENKSVMPVPMDDWHLANFFKAVTNSRTSLEASTGAVGDIDMPSKTKTCAWCGQGARFIYSIPRNWGNIRPILQRGTSRKFYACSDLDAEKVADKMFKDAFEYVEAQDQN
jgi:glycosyltransferase involved in cell wall biosynthesis